MRKKINGGCLECIFWEHKGSNINLLGEDADYGICKRYPPVVIHDPKEDCGYPNQSTQPWTDDIDWCGEWATE